MRCVRSRVSCTPAARHPLISCDRSFLPLPVAYNRLHGGRHCLPPISLPLLSYRGSQIDEYLFYFLFQFAVFISGTFMFTSIINCDYYNQCYTTVLSTDQKLQGLRFTTLISE